MLSSVFYLHLTIKNRFKMMEDEQIGEDTGRGERKDLVTLSVKCQHVLASCSLLLLPLDNKGSDEGKRETGRGRCSPKGCQMKG